MARGAQDPPAAKPKVHTAAKASTGKKSSSKKKTKAVARTPRQTQPDAERSRQIQTALQREGYLKSEPSGKWDAATIDALTRYQKDHGANPTGKPDAHSLAALGLGPKYDNLVPSTPAKPPNPPNPPNP